MLYNAPSTVCKTLLRNFYIKNSRLIESLLLYFEISSNVLKEAHTCTDVLIMYVTDAYSVSG